MVAHSFPPERLIPRVLSRLVRYTEPLLARRTSQITRPLAANDVVSENPPELVQPRVPVTAAPAR